MLRVVIELWPCGFEERKRVLCEGKIWNDSTGSKTRGNYRCEFLNKAGRVWRRGTVKGFLRKRQCAWRLLARCLVEALKGE